MRKLLVTSALPYANGPIHIGHLLEYVQTDIYARYWRLRGRPTLYVCADDTHGTPVMLRARREGVRPEDLIERVAAEHRRDFAGFQIEFDEYHSTHTEENRRLSVGFYRALRERGHVVEREVEQAYSEADGMFLPDRYVKGRCPRCGAADQYGDSCEVCSATYSPRDLIDPYSAISGARPIWRSTPHLFFRIADFAEPLRHWVEGGHVGPEVAAMLRGWFEAGLKDWDISRDAPYFGFEIPDRPGSYFYVWLDAPVGYIAATSAWCRRHGEAIDDYWGPDALTSEVQHFIGKDIVYFHALFWPAMLLGARRRTPDRLNVHGFLTVDGAKMSKSRGTLITAETYLHHLDPQHLRYYLAARLGPGTDDVDLNFGDFASRVNADLVNKIANIPSRVLAILTNKLRGRLEPPDSEGRDLVARTRARVAPVAAAYEGREFARVARELCALADGVNLYLDARAPWDLARIGDPAAGPVCTAALNAFKVVATLIQPILPAFAARFAPCLGLGSLAWDDIGRTHDEGPVLPYRRLVERVDPARVQAIVDESK